MLQPEWVHRPFERTGLFSGLSDRQKDILILLFFCALMFLPGLGLRDPWPADEPRFALAAKQMVQSGHWFFPMLGPEYYPDKPPMFMWMIAVFYALTGSMKVAFLIPSTLAATTVILLVYDLGRRLWSRREGLAAAGSLLIMVQFIIQGKSAQIDMVLTFWTTLALYGMIRYLLLGDSIVWFLGGSFCMGLGIITKGVGFLPIFLLVPYALALWRGWTPIRRGVKGRVVWAPIFMLLGTLVWFVPMYLLVASSNDPALLAYRDNILFRQTADRYLNSWHHIKPFWYYILQVMPWAWLPFSPLIVNYSRRWWNRMKQGDNRIWTLVLWGLLVLLFFSLSKGKRGVYILPITPAFALLMGAVQEQVFASGKVQTYFRVFGYVLGGLFFGIGAVIMVASISGEVDSFATRLGGTGFTPPPWLFAAFIVTGVLMIIIARLRGKGKFQGHHSAFVNMLVVALFLSVVLWPVLNPIRSPRQMMQDVRTIIGPQAELGMVSWKEQLLLQAIPPVQTFGRKTDRAVQLQAAVRWLREGGAEKWLLIDGTHDAGPFDRADAVYRKRLHGRDWLLFKASDMKRDSEDGS